MPNRSTVRRYPAIDRRFRLQWEPRKCARPLVSRGNDQAQHQRRRDPEALRRQGDPADITASSSSRSEPPGLSADVFAFVAMAGKEMDHVAVMNAQAKVRTAVVAVIGADLSLPAACVFCYNPTDFTRTGPECPRRIWLRVLR